MSFNDPNREAVGLEPIYRQTGDNDQTADALRATAGSPGRWEPGVADPPANAAGATSLGVVAVPATAWTLGQYVQGSIAGAPGEMTWTGSAWVGGRAPAGAETFDPSEHTVDEVNAYLEEHPEDERRVLRAERAGKARVGVLGE